MEGGPPLPVYDTLVTGMSLPPSSLQACKGHVFYSGNLHLRLFVKVSMKNSLSHTERKGEKKKQINHLWIDVAPPFKEPKEKFIR